ncbi:predicted protein [Sclerotinia sclerotiorum 1980 UF-70]|uniref:Uncharacterized protein n=1 Tax=Sclerotinia sclerotiorum (strain ATCC 18683 / 1980 / Ss-1) TaxID=665079 RepID=A7ERA2_SCLS1|nr:predicted protein [Sclerotinia sclerotiorum 1980 UF-70]EDN91994.1 predicted protein [Sclerotinia sclerotiorum 1980 UF-70]
MPFNHSPIAGGYTSLSWTTGYRASRPFEPAFPSPSRHPILPPRHPHPQQQPHQNPTPFYTTQLHLSRPPTIPNTFPHPIPPTTTPLPTLLHHLNLPSNLQNFSNSLLYFFTTIPIAIFQILTTIRPYYFVLRRYIREFEWRALVIAVVVFFFVARGSGCGNGDGEGDGGYGDGTGRGEVKIVMDPAYVVMVRNCRSMEGLLRAGEKGEVLVV